MTTSKENTYARLEQHMLNYEDYADIPVNPSGERLVPIIGNAALRADCIRDDAQPVTGSFSYVRSGVLERLLDAADIISRWRNGMQLDVRYGYRSLSVQTARFSEIEAGIPPELVGEARRAAAHRMIAVPELAGHPAGAAVDICISQNGRQLNFGTAMWDFVPDAYTYSPYVSREARVNRWRLLDTMCEAGFAPFLGEWWHFSYGDKEWAKYYNQPAALYDQIEFRAPDITV